MKIGPDHLARVVSSDLAQDGFRLTLTKVSGETSDFMIAPESLARLLDHTIRHLHSFSKNPRFPKESVVHQPFGIEATGLTIEAGRNENEALLTVQFGAAALHFFVSVNDVVQAMVAFQGRIVPTGRHGRH